MAVLLLLTGPLAGRRHEVTGEVVLGRSPSCTIPLEDAKVSRRHVRFAIDRGQTRVSDLGSRNGTLVNGEKIEGDVVLLAGDRIQVGDTTIVFEPPAPVVFDDKTKATDQSAIRSDEAVVPPEGARVIHEATIGLLSASSEAAVLQRGSAALQHAFKAKTASVFACSTEVVYSAAVSGAQRVDVPVSLVIAALEKKEASGVGSTLCAPLSAEGGAPFGALFIDCSRPVTAGDRHVVAVLGRFIGEMYTSFRGRSGTSHSGTLVGGTRQYRELIDAARKVAALSSSSVLISGEAGSGRYELAHFIHERSSRAQGPVAVVDCRKAQMALEEELFGTNGGNGVPPLSSVLVRAEGGTLILREVQALPKAIGDRLAKFLTRKKAPGRNGGEVDVDVRLIATSTAPAGELATRSELNTELAQALSEDELTCPSLRQRAHDVVTLFEHFASAVTRARRKELPVLTTDAKRLLTDYSWPGNVQELKLVAERIALLYPGVEVPANKLPSEMQDGTAVPVALGRSLAEMVSRLEREAISDALREARGKKIKAAAILGISRPTLDKKISEFQLTVEKRRE